MSDYKDVNGPGLLVGVVAWLIMVSLIPKGTDPFGSAILGLGFVIPAGAIASIASGLLSKK